MPLTHVRNARLYHAPHCAVFTPVTWVYDRDEPTTGEIAAGKLGSMCVYDYVSADCNCRGKMVPPIAVLYWVGAVVVGIIVGVLL